MIVNIRTIVRFRTLMLSASNCPCACAVYVLIPGIVMTDSCHVASEILRVSSIGLLEHELHEDAYEDGWNNEYCVFPPGGLLPEENQQESSNHEWD